MSGASHRNVGRRASQEGVEEVSQIDDLKK